MKKLLMAATAIAGLGIATPALADGTNTGADTEVFNINAVNPAKCNLESNSYTVNLGDNVISNDGGFARTDIGTTIANKLNALDINAWCTGSGNSLVLSRSSLNTGNGQVTDDGFNRAVAYDIAMSIAGATRTDGTTPLEGSADGVGNGPGVGIGAGLKVSRFGPDGDGAAVSFVNEAGSVSGAVLNGTTSEPARSFFNTDASRLVAGTYTGTVTITLTPGV